MRYYPVYLNLTGGPAVVTGGGEIAQGKMPALAAHLRRELEKSFGDEYVQLLEITTPLREQLAAQHLDYTVRQQLWRKLFEETNIVDLLRRGETESARSVAKEVLGL